MSVSDASLDEAALRAFCASQLADYKVPESFTGTTDRLPRSPNGKLMKQQMRETAAALPEIEPRRRKA